MEPWRELRSLEQNDLLQAACGDLSAGLSWYGNRLSKDEWRWLICAAVLRAKIVPGINMGDGHRGVVTLGGSSRKLSKAQGTEAITLAFSIGDAPWEQDPTQNKPVQWSATVRAARGISQEELQA